MMIKAREHYFHLKKSSARNLIKENRMDDLVKASADEAYRQQLFEALGQYFLRKR